MTRQNEEEFLQLITQFQPRLYGYLLTLMGNPDDANDVLQETNVNLWEGASKYEPGTNFKAWAFRVAHFQVMSYRQRRVRDRVTFSNDLVATLAVEASAADELQEARRELLSECLKKLPKNMLTVVGLRYLDGLSVSEIATKLSLASNAISQRLFRARRALEECVVRSMT
ncbi:ECF RNA polymerase sigma factor SigH [Posidoniimonas polymericola]|uniref:ECF RNA polymerase sigma factor SigH n=1 Tax=Posidoniimonas polymericola TaxID=2528002 RepID=A0A5C5XW78_9BACT|nr:sigma-70 family RNA polymerase sigma factor [Posidoniimonas polymericola]TWT66245.1 ECF RNA polymerase sigma factor SigH [Posidoniimonas polymericola]